MSEGKAIRNLNTLISTMEPILNEGKYVYASVKDSTLIPRGTAICEVREAEGTTFILPKTYADKNNIAYGLIVAWITLNVHSALEAVGLTAAFASALGKSNISCNVVAGYYHDHIFVAYEDAPKAMDVLKALSLTSS